MARSDLIQRFGQDTEQRLRRKSGEVDRNIIGCKRFFDQWAQFNWSLFAFLDKHACSLTRKDQTICSQ